MGVLLQGFFFAPDRVKGVPSPLDGDGKVPFWWDHLAAQAHDLRTSGFSAIWLPPPLKGSSGTFSSGYDLFDDYDLGNKNQRGTIPTRCGSREQLERCVAVMRANGIDVYVDMVENQRDGDDGHFNFRYLDSLGQPDQGRFAKGPGDFHPHVPEDPGVVTDAFQFGRDLAPINGVPKDHCFNGLVDAADWLTRALDIQGYRLDNVKGVSTNFMTALLSRKSMAGKFAVGEYFDGNIGWIQGWMGAVQHRSGAFDFPLRFALQAMCNNPGSFDMSTLDHAGLTGADPLGSVTFVENHDTDLSSPIVRNKMLAYACILTSEGYPCVFYRDYSTDQHCFALKPRIDRLISIHEHLADGPTIQRWKDRGVFAFERTGGRHLLVALNNDEGNDRTIHVQTGFPPHTPLEEYANGGGRVTTDATSSVTLTVPKNVNGLGYVCYAPAMKLPPFAVERKGVAQDYEGAADLDIPPAREKVRTKVCRVFAETGTTIEARLLDVDKSRWSPTTAIQVDLEDPGGSKVAGHKYDKGAAAGAKFDFAVRTTGFHTFFLKAANLPVEAKSAAFRLNVVYTAPQKI